MKTYCILIVMAGMLGNAYSQNCIIACYNFNGNAKDNCGNSNDGVVNGATLTQDRFGNTNAAYQFDGVDDYINIGDLTTPGDFSISVWAFNNDVYGLKRAVIDKWDDWRLVGEDGAGEPWLSSGGIEFGMFNGATRFGAGHVTSTTGLWQHLVGVFDSSSNSMILYVDGVVVGTDTFSGSRSLNTISIFIGAKVDFDPASFFDGVIDDVILYGCALSSIEVVDLYNCGVVSSFTTTDTIICQIDSVVFSNTNFGGYTFEWFDNGTSFSTDENPTALFTTSGVHNIELIASNGGCLDTSSVLEITVNANTDTITLTACDSFMVPSGDEIYTSSGTFTDTILNVDSCDSVITINLTITSKTTSTITPTACDSYTSPSSNYTWTSSGIFMDTIPNSDACDSIITVNLTIDSSTSTTINPVACDVYTSPSGNNTWTSSGTYLDTIPNSAGCDSVITINLTINPSPTVTITGNSNICFGNSTMLSTSGGTSYLWSNSATTSLITVSPVTDTTYSVMVTDSNGCMDTSTVNVVVHPLPFANAGQNDTICAGENTTLSGSGGVSCSWIPITALNDPTICNPVANPSSTITYNLTVIDSNGCENMSSVSISGNGYPTT